MHQPFVPLSVRLIEAAMDSKPVPRQFKPFITRSDVGGSGRVGDWAMGMRSSAGNMGL